MVIIICGLFLSGKETVNIVTKTKKEDEYEIVNTNKKGFEIVIL